MSKFIISGGKKLSGTIKVAGNKNAALPIMAAALLIPEDVILENVPEIKDVAVMSNILTKLGATVEKIKDHSLKINTKNVSDYKVPVELARQLRASVLLMGPLLARFGTVELPHPGGDLIGKRSIGSHLRAFEMLHAKIEVSPDFYKITSNNDFHPRSRIFLDEPSVTATENLLMAVAYNAEELWLENVALEPHVQDLIRFLGKAGMKTTYRMGNWLQITGSKKMRGVAHTITPDYVEAGTFAVLAAATQSNIAIQGDCLEDLRSPLAVLSSMGVEYRYKGIELELFPSILKASEKRIQAGPHPNFPTDLMSSFIVLATQAQGQTLLHDPMYESRMFFVDKLIRMGAQITICDPHRVIVYGPTELNRQHLFSPDIRAGMALVIAALCAKGESVIENAEMIERGYERIDERLRQLGADITRYEE